MNRKQRTIIFSIILPCILLAALVWVSVWGSIEHSKAVEYKTATESGIKRAYSDMSSALLDLEVALSKLEIVGTRAKCIELLNEASSVSGTCVGLMAQIPASHVDSYELNQFFVRLGDYSNTLSNSLLRGRVLSNSDKKQLSDLKKTCQEVSADIYTRYTEENYSTKLLSGDEFTSENNGTKTEATRIEYPTLIYDGPFAESSEKAEAKGLTGKEISDKEAYMEVKRFLPGIKEVSLVTTSMGKIPSYDFTGKDSAGRHFDISISKKGGGVIWYLSETTGSKEGTPTEEERKEYQKSGAIFLREKGFSGMKSEYMQYYSGMVLINFFSTENGVILYNDLIKVWVDRESKEIIGIDAKNYWYSHVDRGEKIKAFDITQEQAKEYLSENLEIKSVAKALIPQGATKEVLCYEFFCSYNEAEYIVYINAASGYEEQIFMIINSGEGDQVM